jgi:hypothetical protein
MVAVAQGKVPYRIRFASMRLIRLKYKDSERLRWSEPDANFRIKAGFVGPGFGFEAWLKAGPAGASPVGRGVVGPLRRGLGEGARVVWGCPAPDGMPPSFSSGQLVTKAIGGRSVARYPRFALNHASRSVFSCRGL